MNHNIIFDTIVNHQTKDAYERVEDIRRELSEKEESLIRSQTMLMLDRNQGNHHIHKRKTRLFCIRGVALSRRSCLELFLGS